MANEKKLDRVILGMLCHQDMTGYEIKKRMDTVFRFFWGASYGSIYPTLRELVEGGLATKSASKRNGRENVTYSITGNGRSYLRDWLALPAEKDELRYETLLKLFFSDEAGGEAALEHVQRFEEKIRRELGVLRAMANQLEGIQDENRAHKYYLLTAKFGIKSYEAYLEWCEEAKVLL